MKNFGKTTDIRDIITVGYEADNAVLYSTSQSLTNNQKAQARINIGAGTSSFDGNYNSLSNKPTIPKKTSELDNDSNFATTSQVEAKYTKPSGGIPKTDLATAVQNSLTAADNAVKYTSQSLTDAQKVQARANIGAGTSNFSGSYDDLTNKPSIPAAVSIVQSTGESTSSVMSQKATTDAVNGRLSKTDNTNIEVLGTKKATTTLGGNQLYAPNGIIFGGTAAAAGLVTRGICGISTPSDGGACSKENLYINYDGNNDFNAGRQVVLNAGTVGNHLGSNMYQYAVPRGEIVKNWVEAKGYATSVKVNGNTIASSGGVVDIGTVLADASKFATSAQGSNADSALAKANANATEISNIKNGTNGTKVKYAEHADAADSATSAGTADKVANGLTLGGGVVYDGSKALSITAGDKMSITGGPGGVSIGLAYSVMPSTYNKVTVDGYGTVTAGENIDYLTSHQSIKSINTNNTAAQTVNASEAIAGSGTINLHKVAKTGSYNDLSNKPTIPTVNNGTLTIQKNGTKVATFGANQSTNTTANITVPTKTSELTNDSGFLTSHQDISGKLDKTAYEVNKTINFGSSGVLYVGKFKVYDTNVTCEVTSTTDVTYSGKLVIATQNYVIKQMTVYGDAANTVAPNFFIKPSTTSDPYIEVYFKPSSWSKNVVHIYGSNIEAEPTNVCTNVPSVPSTATSKPTNALNSKANLDGANEFTDGTNTFRDIDGTTQISGSQVILKAIGVMGSASLSVQTDNNNEVFGVESDSESGVIHLNKTISLNGDMGTAGQVLTSQGASAAPQWKSMPTYSLSGTTLTITLP